MTLQVGGYQQNREKKTKEKNLRNLKEKQRNSYSQPKGAKIKSLDRSIFLNTRETNNRININSIEYVAFIKAKNA